MIVVLDTNVLVSGIFFHGPPAAILDQWVEGRFDVYATYTIIEEYLRVLGELSALRAPRFEHRWTEVLLGRCHLIPDAGPSVPWPRDRSDAKFVECAVQAGAHYLVSGDLDLLSYHAVPRLHIVSPRQFLQRL